ncbi:MAG: cytidine deaminase [Halanaerobiaceae bacterium]
MVNARTLRTMKKRAREAKGRAYVPYSNFPLGAALLTAENNIYMGCNIENSSYGLSVCAERTAVFNAVAAGENHFKALLLVTETEEPVFPCGACRQVLAEFDPEGKMEIIICTDKGKETKISAEKLLPSAFNKGDLISDL